jgi:hypothetical protein
MLERSLRFLTGRGLRRGAAGSRAWLVTALVAIGVRALRRLARSEPEVLYRTRVHEGERFVITTRGPE